MKTLTPKKANELKANGTTHIASIVKSHYNTTYYHVNAIDALITNGGKWIAAPRGQHGDWHGRIGINGNRIDWTVTRRTDAI